ncbi:phosphatidate cytidylyltransferase [Spongiibacter sp. UBA1325]|uniref:phosphatidate cytidylyltransferase n=1 Tax=Spongiibacter sp. UBA1325 TaxID=1947543 RepID=UPI002579C492|nr:phosphatidate cytidylyltransferase [Spongiibacter sp. UBA1325]|tara:strand:- start:4519 stop:5355 length:837 start_codon:yes stop_codon:yes gene_type:complete
MLKQRIITAVVIVAALLAAMAYLSAGQLSLLFAGIVLVAAWEWADLSDLRPQVARLAYVLVIGALIASVYALLGDVASWSTAALQELFVAACVWWAVALLWVKGYPVSAGLWGSRPVRIVMGVAVLLPTWLALSYLRNLPNGAWLLLMLVALVAIADIGAYFFGRRFGKAKLAPAVSPGKSWAGFWGGLACSVSFMAALWYFWPGGMPVSLPAMLVLAAITSLASVLGDLLESMVKRHRGIKDSSQLLPGHGGVMDRVDSLTAASPVFALGLMSVGWQ